MDTCRLFSSKVAITTWCVTVVYVSWFYCRPYLSTPAYLFVAIPITISHVFLFYRGGYLEDRLLD